MEGDTIITAVLSAILGGGLISSIVAFKKDSRDSRMTELDFTKQIREIAQEEVQSTRDEMVKLKETTAIEISRLSKRVYELERQLKNKENVISSLIIYIKILRDILTTNKHPLPQVPEDIKPYIR